MTWSIGSNDMIDGDVEKQKQAKPAKGPTRRGTNPFKRSATSKSDKIAGSWPEPPRVRRDIRPRKGYVFNINKAKIFEATQHHVEYSYSGTTLSGLAKFDDCTDYGVSEAVEKKLLELEVSRLVDTVTCPEPFLFDSGGLLGSTERATFEDVSNLADQIFCNFEIIRHDNARVSLEHCPETAEQVVGYFKRSRQHLVSRFKQDQTRVKGASPKVLDPPERNQKLYFALVDYIVGSIGRVVVRTATSDYWVQQTLSVLAQWATKSKVLSYNPEHYANVSLDNGESVIEQLNAGFASKQAFFLKIRLGPTSADQKDMDALDTESDVSGRYYREKTFFRKNIRYLLKYNINSLHNPADSSTPASCFETCSGLYRTGLDGALTSLSSDRMSQVSASSDLFRVKCSYCAMELALKNLKELAAERRQRKLNIIDAAKGTDIPETIVNWECSDSAISDKIPRSRLAVHSMDDLISLIIPLDLASVWTAKELDDLITLAGSGTDDEDPIIQFDKPPKAFQAWFTVSTADWLSREKLLSRGKYRDPDIQPVSGSPMRLGIRAGTDITKMLKQGDISTSPSLLTESNASKIEAQYQIFKSKMDRWVIAEETITIKCRVYVSSIIFTAIFIVCGAMAVPFVVGTRIRGVDPFQITTYAWVIAGFMTILAKSRYVSEWPWHDFLRGHVVCSSVKDVCDVTRIDAQMVIMYLLLEERINTLRTKGPYNGMFSRQSEGGTNGFAIDESVHLSTMLASGFLMLKVLNEHGEHLICLDIRKGSKGEGPLKGETSKYLACMDIGKDAEYDSPLTEPVIGKDEEGSKDPSQSNSKSSRGREVEKVKKLSPNEFRWNRILGLYVRDSTFG